MNEQADHQAENVLKFRTWNVWWSEESSADRFGCFPAVLQSLYMLDGRGRQISSPALLEYVSILSAWHPLYSGNRTQQPWSYGVHFGDTVLVMCFIFLSCPMLSNRDELCRFARQWNSKRCCVVCDRDHIEGSKGPPSTWVTNRISWFKVSESFWKS